MVGALENSDAGILSNLHSRGIVLRIRHAACTNHRICPRSPGAPAATGIRLNASGRRRHGSSRKRDNRTSGLTERDMEAELWTALRSGKGLLAQVRHRAGFDVPGCSCRTAGSFLWLRTMPAPETMTPGHSGIPLGSGSNAHRFSAVEPQEPGSCPFCKYLDFPGVRGINGPEQAPNLLVSQQ